MLTTIRLKLKTKHLTKSPRIRFDPEKLKDPITAEVFQDKVGEKFAALCVLDSDVDTLANNFENGFSQRLKRSLGDRLSLCDPRRQLKQQKYTSREAGLRYIKVNREVRKKMTAAKEEWTEERCKNAEKEMVSGNSKEAYNTPMALTKTQQRKSAVIEDSSGNILMESTAVLNRWTEYCSGIYN